MNKKRSRIDKLLWFGNDADGLSMVDLLALCTFLAWFGMKIIQVVFSVKYQQNQVLMTQLNNIMIDVSEFMYIVICFYFGKKTIDTTITKVGLFKSNMYKSLDTMLTPPKEVEDTTTMPEATEAAETPAIINEETSTQEKKEEEENG